MTGISTNADSAPSDAAAGPLSRQEIPHLPAGSEVVISAERALVRLGGRPIWQDVTFEMRTGEFLAILGRMGQANLRC